MWCMFNTVVFVQPEFLWTKKDIWATASQFHMILLKKVRLMCKRWTTADSNQFSAESITRTLFNLKGFKRNRVLMKWILNKNLNPPKKTNKQTSYMFYYLTNHIFKPILPHHPSEFPDLVLECPAGRYRV